MRNFKTVRASGLIAASLLLAACGGAGSGDVPGVPGAGEDGATQETGSPAESAAAQETATVRVASSGICVCHGPIYVGMETGIFEKHGIEVDHRQTPSGFESQAMVAAGEVEIGDSALAVAAAAASQGLANTAVFIANGDPSGEIGTDDYFAVVARGDGEVVEGDLTSLRGKSIGAATGTIAHLYLLEALEAAGVSPDEVTVQNVSPPDLPTALQSGSVDAIVGWEPAPLLALDLVDGSFTAYRGGNHIDYLFMNWANDQWLDANPEVAQRFVDAFAEAAAHTRANPEEAAAIISTALGMEEEMVAEMLSYLTFDMRYSQVTKAGLQQQIDFAREFGGFQGEYSFDDHYSAELTETTVREHAEFFEDLPEVEGQ